jgi:hypothetical protein
MKTIIQIAREYINDNAIILDDKTLAGRIRNYISNCMEALGASLSSFTDRKRVNSFKINNELENHIINLLDAHLSNGVITPLTSKTQLRDNIRYRQFGNGTLTEDIVFVAKQFISENFTDKVYNRLKNKVRKNIQELDKYRQSMVTRINSMPDLTSGLFFITFNDNIFDFTALDIYFQKVEECCMNYEIGDEKRLSEKDVIILDFLALENELKNIDKQREIEVLKEIYFDSKK